ncbi:MAG: aromatic aminobenezylarsenical efflux permease ArsG family transporter [Bacteroidales bacterium]|jgi:cytochrome c biogenesis protein CcdA|nr:aromatic aminobenezylarsenical efflux permease ArsG family transporter [Bacteroidales bacterium]
MDFLQSLADNSQIPVLTAFILGLITSMSPCPLATNITATAWLSRDITNKKAILLNGVMYTLGRMFTYTSLGLLFYFGASKFQIAKALQNLGGVWLGVALLIFGILMLDIIKIPGLPGISKRLEGKKIKRGFLNSFLLGVLFALAFCPYSGVIYFVVLIPMTIAAPSGLFLPPTFAIATGLPVIAVSWLLAYSVTSVGKFYNGIKNFEKWFKRVVASVFIIIGIYYIAINLL